MLDTYIWFMAWLGLIVSTISALFGPRGFLGLLIALPMYGRLLGWW